VLLSRAVPPRHNRRTNQIGAVAARYSNANPAKSPGFGVGGGKDPISTEEHLRKLYYDLAGSPGSNALAPLLEMTERSHILYGSDYVHTPEAVVSAHLAELLSSKLLSADDFRAIGRGNALALFPRLA